MALSVRVLEGNVRLIRATFVTGDDDTPTNQTEVRFYRQRVGRPASERETWEYPEAIDHDADEPGVYTKVLAFPRSGRYAIGAEAVTGDVEIYDEIEIEVSSAKARP